jgi:hypothetical protein
MLDTPSPTNEKQLKEVHISIVNNKPKKEEKNKIKKTKKK